jgi:hypothetical protein
MSSPNEPMKSFVQDVLGCQCPPAVFSSMVYTGPEDSSEQFLLSGKLNVGNTLLIYFSSVSDRGDLFRLVPTLGLRGKCERDDNGFNRFRLVLVSPECDSVREMADPIFASLDFMDEKLHLHVVHPDDIPWVL